MEVGDRGKGVEPMSRCNVFGVRDHEPWLVVIAKRVEARPEGKARRENSANDCYFFFSSSLGPPGVQEEVMVQEESTLPLGLPSSLRREALSERQDARDVQLLPLPALRSHRGGTRPYWKNPRRSESIVAPGVPESSVAPRDQRVPQRLLGASTDECVAAVGAPWPTMPCSWY